MPTCFTPRNLLALLALLFAFPCFLTAETVPVRQPQGALHGFLSMRSPSGELIAHGEYTQIAHGSRINARLVFHFLDGSLDDDNVTFTQNRVFHFVSEHHIQKGPFFSKAVDLTIGPNGQVTTRITEKDGKEKVETQHIDLPADLSNGMVSVLVLNISPNRPQTELSMLVPADKLRMVKLKINPDGNAAFNINGVPHTAALFRIKIEIGGIAGIVAPIVGKKPEDVMLWVLEGEAPVFIREVGQLSQDTPMVSIEFLGATFPKDASTNR